VVAGETSQGKSSLALCIAKNIAENDIPIAFYSLEMSTIQLCARLTSIASDVSSSEILYSKVDDAKYSLISHGIGKIEGLPMYIDDSRTTNIDGIISSIRYMVSRFGLQAVFIDYLQLADAKGGWKTKEQEVSYMIKRLKNVAKELNICIIAISQLARPATGADHYPTLSRLRHSGEIEQAADIVLFIYRHEYYGNKKLPSQFPDQFKNKETKGYALLDIAKGRNIGVFKFLCQFNAATTHFKDVHINDIPNKSTELETGEKTPF